MKSGLITTHDNEETNATLNALETLKNDEHIICANVLYLYTTYLTMPQGIHPYNTHPTAFGSHSNLSNNGEIKFIR